MLHVLNGDSVAVELRRSGVPGEMLPWCELLTDGPIAVNLADDSVLARRAAYFEAAMGVPAATFTEGCLAQERTLAGFASHDEVVFWCEYDLYDQTLLAYWLHFMVRRPRGNTRLSLVCPGSFPGVVPFQGLGQLNADQLATLYSNRQEITDAQLALGARAWEAYASPDPTAVEALLDDDTGALPFLQTAFTRHLERFPSVRDGLGRVERETLAAVATGVERLLPLFTVVSEQEHLYGLGDMEYWAYLDRLRDGAIPLLRVEGPPSLPRYGDPAPPRLNQWRVALTDAGRRVLAGQEDAARLSGVDRWLGGCYQQGRGPLWRWNEARSRLEWYE